jgi:hypothetical protein
MKKFPLFQFGLSATALLWAACNQAEKVSASEPAPTAHSQTDGESLVRMNQEITLLKQKNLSVAELDLAFRSLLPKYGFPVPALEKPDTPEEGQRTAEMESLQKEAATNGYMIQRWKAVKSFTIGRNQAFLYQVSLPDGQNFTAYTETNAPADPVMLAFYRTSPESSSTIQLVAYNDDRGDGTRNAEITWSNTTGSHKSVYFVVFPLTSSTAGTAAVILNDQNEPLNLGTVTLNAAPVFNHSNPGPFPGCTGPTKTNISLIRTTGTMLTGVLAVNKTTNRGGFILSQSTANRNVALAEVLPNDGTSFVLGFLARTNIPPDFTQNYTAQQKDLYNCTQ